jgi:deazaflavin-dependent oxidoreductase (nitroreductase family)
VGRVGRTLAGRPVLLLETVGRRSGPVRPVVLIYAREGALLVVAGSGGGREVEPAWVANLRANPRSQVVLDGRRRPVHARPAGPGERARLWAALDRVNAGQYTRYQAVARREIPVIVLEPRAPGPDGDPEARLVGGPAAEGGPLAGQVVVVTGATSGIGLAAEEALARLGASLVLVGRDAATGHRAALRVARASGNPAVRAVVADLASRAQVRALGDELARLPRLDVLIHCAGVWHLRRRATGDGIEETLAVNQLAPFALTIRLLPLLRATPRSRVVAASWHAAYGGRVRWHDPGWTRGRCGPYGACAQTKLLNVLFVRELARRIGDTADPGAAAWPLAVAAAPGGVRTKLLAEAGPLPHGFMKLFAVSPERGAETVVWLASAPDLPPGAAGSWFSARRRIPYPPGGRDPWAATRAWELSERLAGLGTPGGVDPGGAGPDCSRDQCVTTFGSVAAWAIQPATISSVGRRRTS